MAQLNLNVVPTHDPKTMGIADTSIYDAAPTGATLEVTPPGFGKVAITNFNPSSVNVFNSNNFGLSSTLITDELIILPDGIWKIRYSIDPSVKNFIQKKFFRTDQIQCKYYQIYLAVDLDDCSGEAEYCLPRSGRREEQEAKLREIEFMINGAIAAANRGEDILAMDMYRRADRMIDRFNVCKTCNS